MTSWAWIDDPKRLAFMLSRYKFVAQNDRAARPMCLRLAVVMDFGLSDCGSVRGKLTAIDFDPEFIESCVATASDRCPIDFRRHDLLKGPVQGNYGAFYSLDVLTYRPKK